MSDEVVYYTGRRQVLYFLLASVAFVAACSFIVFAEPDVSDKVRVAAWAGLPLFALGIVYFAMRLAKPRPVVVLDRRGITDNASIAGGGFIPWPDIEAFEVFEYHGQRMLGIRLKDDRAYLAKLNTLRLGLAKTNLKMGFPYLAIPEASLPLSIEELVDQIQLWSRAGGVTVAIR